MRYLRYIREKKGLSQDRLAELSGASQNNISHIERGLRKPHPATLAKLAGVLEVKDPEMLAMNLSSVQTFEEVISGSKEVREAYLQYKRDVGRLESLSQDLEKVYDAGMKDYAEDSLGRARLEAAFMLGYIRARQEGGAIEERKAS